MPVLIRRGVGTSASARAPPPTSAAAAASRRRTDPHEASRLIRSTVMGMLSVLSAFLLRDFSAQLFQRVTNTNKSLLAQFFYTLIVLGVVVWLAIIWE